MPFPQLPPHLNPPALGSCLKSDLFLAGLGGYHRWKHTLTLLALSSGIRPFPRVRT